MSRKAKKFDTKWNNTPTRGEINTEPDQTIQGEAATIKDMIRILATGEIPQMAMDAFDGYDVDIDKDIRERYAGDLHAQNEAMADRWDELQAEQLEARKQAIKKQQEDKTDANEQDEKEEESSNSTKD